MFGEFPFHAQLMKTSDFSANETPQFPSQPLVLTGFRSGQVRSSKVKQR